MISDNYLKAKKILETIGMPFEEMANDDKCGASWANRTPYVFLTFAGIKTNDSFDKAKCWTDDKSLLPNKRWIERYNEYWGSEGGKVGSGTYDYFFRCPIRYLNEMGVIAINPDKPNRPQTSPARVYGLTEAARDLLVNWDNDEFEAKALFQSASEDTLAQWIKEKHNQEIEITLDRGRKIILKGDNHDKLQKAIVEQFAPEFINDYEVLYIADTTNKQIRAPNERIAELGLSELFEKDLPDVVIWDKEHGWVFIIEAVHSSGVITPSRLDRFKIALGDMVSNAVFVTAFAARGDYKKYVDSIAWKTEVWIAENPKNMIHHDGERFLGPYS